MEQHMQYLMWLKSKQIFKSPMNSFNNTWEEQAFAEDTSGPLGGFVWPPRSYSCTFCRREFRSAQALGGHMNIHRRDRARMKQSLSLLNTDDHQFQLQKLSKTPSTGDDGLSSPFSSVSRGSSKVTQEHTVETNLSVGINLGDSHNLQLGSGNEESTVNSKRHKSSGISSFAFFHKPLSGDRYAFQQREVLRIKTKPLEDIDLELRLGDPPEVK